MNDAKIVVGARETDGRLTSGFLVALIVLGLSGVCAADIRNPSFEDYDDDIVGAGPQPSDWFRWWNNGNSFKSCVTSDWSTESARSAALLNRANTLIYPGNYQSFCQFVDLTGISSIKFDVALVPPSGGTFQHFEASFRVGGTPLWSTSTGGVYLDQEVNVSGRTGWYQIEIRDTAVGASSFSVSGQYYVLWDNLRLMKGLATIPAEIDLDPDTLNSRSNGNWITCHIKLAAGYDPNAIDGATVKLNDVPAYMGQQDWATPEGNEANVTDYDGDGIYERMVKFDRAAVQALIQSQEVKVTVKGRLTGGSLFVKSGPTGGTPFEGTAVIRVLDKDVKGK
jgi:hypothetical protein